MQLDGVSPLANRAVEGGWPAATAAEPLTVRGLIPLCHSLSPSLPCWCSTVFSTRSRSTRWPAVPHTVNTAGHIIHVGLFTEQHPDKLILLSCTVGRWDLLVIPPETEPAAAARLMAAAAIPGSVLTAGALMADEAAIGRGLRDTRNREDTWESEGGSRTAPSGRRDLPPSEDTWK
ncbi:hypothetical protein M444_02380 [Streptomyces sp. Mg1]|nr:hypothetical protein M444_02380 [Streptomyces sp. Mg1]